MTIKMLWVLLVIFVFAVSACDKDDDHSSRSVDGRTDGDRKSDTGLDRVIDTGGEKELEPDVDSVDPTEQGTDEESVPSEGPEFPLGVGDEVPNFTLPAHDGSTFQLTDYLGQIVVIGSHPFAGTAVCTQQTKDLESSFDKFAEFGAVPFAMGVDGSAKQASWAEEMGLERVRILSDSNPKGQVSKMLGIYDGMAKTSKRAIVVIDQDSRVVFKKVYNTLICPKLEPIFEELQELAQHRTD